MRDAPELQLAPLEQSGISGVTSVEGDFPRLSPFNSRPVLEGDVREHETHVREIAYEEGGYP